MEKYVVEMNPRKVSMKQKATVGILAGGWTFLFLFAWKWFWPSASEKNQGLSGVLLEIAFVSVLAAAAITFSPRKFQTLYYGVEVSNGSITGFLDKPRWLKLPTARSTVRAGEVRTIRKFNGKIGAPGGVAISERMGWKSYLGGIVLLYETLPEYDKLKALVESWRAPE